jgi:hypothetical protein
MDKLQNILRVHTFFLPCSYEKDSLSTHAKTKDLKKFFFLSYFKARFWSFYFRCCYTNNYSPYRGKVTNSAGEDSNSLVMIYWYIFSKPSKMYLRLDSINVHHVVQTDNIRLNSA